MGLFESIFKKREEVKKASSYFKMLTAYTPTFHTWNGEIYEAILVRASVDAIARHCAKLKAEIIGKAKEGLKSRLQNKPNPWMEWSQFLYRTATILYVNNTCFIVPVYDGGETVVGYYPVIPSNCSVVTYGDEKEPWLRYHFSNGDVGAIPMNECAILTRFQYKKDFFGENNDALDETMDLLSIQSQGIKEAVKNSNSFRFMAQLANFAKPEDLSNERKRFSKENLQGEDGGGLLLFPNTYKDIKQIDSKAYKVDADEQKLIKENVFDYFGVNENILQNKASAEEWSAFYEGCIEWFAVQSSQALTSAIYTTKEKQNGNMLMLTANRLAYMSNSDKLKVAETMADRGIMTRNEIREIFQLPPIDGGDYATIRGEYYTIDENGNLTRKGE